MGRCAPLLLWATVAFGAEPARRGGPAELAGTLLIDAQDAVLGLALTLGQSLPGLPAALEIEGTLALSARFATASARLVVGPSPSGDGAAVSVGGGAAFRSDAMVWSLDGGVRWRISVTPEVFTEGTTGVVLEPGWQGPLVTPYPVLLWRSGADLWFSPEGAESAVGFGLRVELARDGALAGGAFMFRGPVSHIAALFLEVLRALVIVV